MLPQITLVVLNWGAAAPTTTARWNCPTRLKEPEQERLQQNVFLPALGLSDKLSRQEGVCSPSQSDPACFQRHAVIKSLRHPITLVFLICFCTDDTSSSRSSSKLSKYTYFLWQLPVCNINECVKQNQPQSLMNSTHYLLLT